MLTTIKNFDQLKSALAETPAASVYLTAPWCSGCRASTPIFEELSKELENVEFLKVDVDEVYEAAEHFNISSVPAFLTFKQGKEVDRKIGSMPKSAMKDRIKNNI